MYYGKINKTDIANGPGVRVSLFVSGCRNACPGCFNRETWDFNYGVPYDEVKTTGQIIKALDNDYITGLSILGGEPLEVENVATLTELCKALKLMYSKKDIWLYTGRLYEEVKHLEIMDYIDVLVDGPFIEYKKDISLKYRGSKNQRIIDVPLSKKFNFPVEVDYEQSGIF